MKKLVFAFVIFSFSIVQAQHNHLGSCGTTTAENEIIKARMLENREHPELFASPRTGAPKYIPVTYHLVGRSDGTGKLKKYSSVLANLCAINRCFEDQEFVFYLKAIDESINNTSLFEEPRGSYGITYLKTYVNLPANKNTIHIFVLNKADPPGGGDGTVLAYYSPDGDYLVSRIDQIKSPGYTLCHEFGHFFTLAHTFYGWEAGYDPNVMPTPTISPGGVPTEYVSLAKTNAQGKLICEYAADGFCDTPADYNLGFGWNDCKYTGSAKDPDGTQLDPTEDNFMSYFLQCATYKFSVEQKAAMLADYNSARRNYLKAAYTPPASISASPSYIYPINGETNPSYKWVEFSWEPVPNATEYVLEVAQDNSFSADYHSLRTTNTKGVIKTLAQNKLYFWRVIPFNSSSLCQTSSSARFRTGTLTANNNPDEDVLNMQLLHYSDVELSIKISSDLDQSAQFRLFNMEGKQITTHALNLHQGQHVYKVPYVAGRSSYLAQLQTKSGSQTKIFILN